MMRTVAIVAPHFPEYALQYAAALSRSCKVIVCVDRGQLNAEYEGRETPALSSSGEMITSNFKTPGDLLRLVWIIFRAKADVLHLQEAVGPRRRFFNAVLAAVVKPFGKIALTVHDPAPHPGRDGNEGRRAQFLRDYVRRTSDFVIVHGQYCLDQYIAVDPPARQKVILSAHGGILSPSIEGRPLDDPLRMYLFGRMESYKGIEILCQAVEILHQQAVPFRLTIAGKGPELDRLQSRFSKLPEVRVFNGFAPPVEVINSLQASHCVVMPYTSATQSGIAAAAFANHRFVIASRIGGLVDVVTNMTNGLLVEPGDVPSLVNAIKQVAADPGLRASLMAAAKHTATTDLSWERIASDVATKFFDPPSAGGERG